MLEDTGIPDVGKTELPEVVKPLTGEVAHLTTAVFLDRTTGQVFSAHVSVEPGQCLIDQQLAIIFVHDDVVYAYHSTCRPGFLSARDRSIAKCSYFPIYQNAKKERSHRTCLRDLSID